MIIKAGRNTYRLYSFTGRVNELGKDFVTYTFSQSIKGKYTHHEKWQPPVRVENPATSFRHIFLSDKNGKEHSVRLADFDIACREGHEITAIWAVKPGEERGPYIILRNNTTRQAFYSHKEISNMYSTPFLLYLIIIPGYFFTAYYFSYQIPVALLAVLPGLLTGWLISNRIKKTAAKKFIARFKHEQ